MKTVARWTALGAALMLTVPAQAAPITVNVRVEGSAVTYYEGPVTTDARTVKDHACTPPGQATPSPTLITALDDVAATGALFWSGTYYDSYSDFFVDEIGADVAGKRTSDKGTTTTYWVLANNFEASSTGGCQTAIKDGDRVLFAFGSEARPLLELSSVPVRAAVGESFDVLVTQRSTTQVGPQSLDGPAVGASVEGNVAGPDGLVHLTYTTPGIKRFKATREGAVRSNAGQVCVYVKGSGDCGTAAPAGGGTSTPVPEPPTSGGSTSVETPRTTVAVTSTRDGRSYRAKRAPRKLRGSATGAGVTKVEVRLRRQVGKRCAYLEPRSRRFVTGSSCGKTKWIAVAVSDSHWTLALPKLAAGRYTADVRTFDSAGGRADARTRFRVT